MKPEIPASGIFLKNDFGDSKWYGIACDCGCSLHDHVMNVEADDHGVGVEVYVTVSTNWSGKFKQNHMLDNSALIWLDRTWKSIANAMTTRLKYTRDIWIHGRVEMDTYLIMNEQQAINYSHTISRAVNDVKQFKETHK